MTAGNASAPVVINANAQVDLRSTSEIHLKKGFSARQFSSTGYFHAQIIPSLDNLVVDYVSHGPVCFNEGNGNLSIAVSGGGGSYQYSLDGGDFTNSSSWADITVGSHTVIVRDNGGMTATVQVEVPAVDLATQ